jgi:hypothetical protein
MSFIKYCHNWLVEKIRQWLFGDEIHVPLIPNEEDVDEMVRSIIAHVAHDHPFLREGRYITEGQINEVRAEVCQKIKET